MFSSMFPFLSGLKPKGIQEEPNVLKIVPKALKPFLSISDIFKKEKFPPPKKVKNEFFLTQSFPKPDPFGRAHYLRLEHHIPHGSSRNKSKLIKLCSFRKR